MKPQLLFLLGLVVALGPVQAADAEMRLLNDSDGARLQVLGDPDDDWRFQISNDLVNWRDAVELGTLLAGDTNAPTRSLGAVPAPTFYRAVRTAGLYDPTVLRTFNLTFNQSNWASLLTTARTNDGNVPGSLTLDNGATNTAVGARYKGNSSFMMGGVKKSLNVTLNYTNDAAELMGYEVFNLNNAAGDETLMREPVYFTVMSRYTVCPKAALAQLYINGANWGVYSLAQNGDGDLVKEWFPSNDGRPLARPQCRRHWRLVADPGAVVVVASQARCPR